jgi:hypothetical protein
MCSKVNTLSPVSLWTSNVLYCMQTEESYEVLYS